MNSLFRRILYLVRLRRHERELAEEMEFHRSLAGAPAFGNATLAREDARRVWIGIWLETVWQDMRYAVRSLWRDKAFTGVALGALGAAIGLNASLFTTFNGIMLRPWPVPDPARVVMLVRAGGPAAFSVAEYAHFAAASRSFDGLVISRCLDGVTSGCTVRMDDAELNAELVSRNYFDVLRIAMVRGAGFHPSATGSGEALAVISESAWRTRFAADPAIIGRVIRLDDVPFTVTGVAAPGFTGTQMDRKDLWIPLDASARLRPDQVIDNAKTSGIVAGRLAPGTTRAHARAEIDTLSRQFHAAAPAPGGSVELIDSTFLPGSGQRSNANSVFALMLLAVALVLGLACANVGNLLLARASARRREVAVRLAIGASRTRLVRQLLTECLLLSMVAAGIGLVIARWLPGLILAQLTGPLSFRVEPDGRVLASTIALAIAACFGFGLAPAWQGSRPHPAAGLFGRSLAPQARLAGISLRSVLLTSQVAIAIVLLVSAGLLVRGVRAISAANPGFNMQDVAVVSFQLPASYETPQVRAFARQILDAAPALGGRTFGFAEPAPFGAGGRLWTTMLDAKNRPEAVLGVEASAGYFSTLGIPIVLGRNFEPGDPARKAVLVNETLARQFWPGTSPLGLTVQSNGAHVVVGVVKDVRHYAFAVRATLPTIYTPIDGRTIPQILVRGIDQGSIPAIESFSRALDPRVRVTVAPLAANLEARLTTARVSAWLASAVGILGLILATLGVFSVFAYTVEQRTAEIGIRMALGARPRQVLRTILSANGGALTAGLVCGLAASAATGRILRSFLFGLSPFDPLSYALVTAVLCAAGLVATVYPARKATRIDPVRALRCE